jgi:hypothetical protein
MKKIPSIILDDQSVEKVTAFLFHAGGSNDPQKLIANEDKSFQGSVVLGMGFTFDDSNPNATTIIEMQRLTGKNSLNQERIFPYIGGEEVNSSPIHAHHRYVINFGELSEEEARAWPDLMSIIEQKVKPERMNLNMNTADGRRRANTWWQWGRYTPALFRAIKGLDRVLVCCIVSKYLSFAFLPTKMVYSHKLNVFALEKYSSFGILQGRIHEVWAWFFSSTMKDDLNYSPSDCFEPFPFPENWETNPDLEEIGQKYYEFRAALMIRNNQGLTDTYNRFHDPDENDPDILKLRELHIKMDAAVLAAYGWTDISTTCEFRLDYEDEGTTSLVLSGQTDFESTEGQRKRKKPWRYRWPAITHDEVLARLLELNQQRHEAETLKGQATKKKKATPKKSKSTTPKKLKGVLKEKQLTIIPPDVEQLDFF